MKKSSIEKITSKRYLLLASTALVAAGIAFLSTNPALAEIGATELPTGGTVAEGSASFSNPDTSTLQINQSSDRVVIDWASFNIGTDATTEFVQPNSGSLAINRIHDADASQILGTLKANGQIMLLNSNGVLFGENATIDVGGIIASTGELTNTNAFMNGADPVLSNFGDASVINNATITIADAGLAAFVAPTVVNNGVIVAKTGRIGLAGANGDTTVTVDLYGDGLFELAAGTQSGSVSVDNQGTSSAEGGQILLTAATAKNIVDGVINTDGILDVQSVTVEGGKIILSAGENGDVTATGTMDASGTNGGLIDVYGQNVDVDATISADGGMGGDGNGDGGDVYIIGENDAIVRGTITAKGGDNGGNGGFVETSGYDTLTIEGLFVSTRAINNTYGTWSLDPVDFTINTSNVGSINGAESDIEIIVEEDFTIATNIALAAQNASLNVDAGNSISVGNNNIALNGGNLSLSVTDASASKGNVSINSTTIDTNGGDVNFFAVNDVTLNGNNNSPVIINTDGGDITVEAGGTFKTTTGRFGTAGGDVTVTADDVNFQSTTINTTGGDDPGSIGVEANGVSGIDQDGFGNGNTFTFTLVDGDGNALDGERGGGDITITSTSSLTKNNGNCFKAGGSSTSCTTGKDGVSDPLINLVITIGDWSKIYGEDDPLYLVQGEVGDTYWAITGGTLNGGDTLAIDLTRSGDENVGTYSISQTGYTLTNADQYSITFFNGDFTITPAALTVTANSDIKTYDGASYTAGSNGFTYSGFVNGDTEGTVTITGDVTYGGTADGAINAGLYTIEADGTLSTQNYTFEYADGSLTVNKAELTVTAADQTMAYGGSLPTLTASYNGFVTGEGEGDLTTLATVTSGTDATANAGTYTGTLTASGAEADNYTFKYVAGDLTINKADLLITANNDSKIYDGLEYTGGSGVSYDSFVNGDGASNLGGTLIYGGDSQGAVDANTYSITVSGLTSDNYNITYAPGTLTVDPKALTLAVKDASKAYGDLNPDFDGTLTGVVDGDTVTVTYDTGATQFSDAGGLYTINGTLSGADLGNYTLDSYTAGKLTINQAYLLLTASDVNKTYGDTVTFDGSADEYEITAGTLYTVNGDSITGATITSDGADATANVNGSPYDIVISAVEGTNLSNYDIHFDTGALTVDQKALTLVVDSTSKTYGDVNPELSGTLTGVINSDDVDVTYSTDATQFSNVGTYGINGTLNGTDLDNYTLAVPDDYTAGTLTINKAALTLTANDATKTYGTPYSFNGDEFSITNGTLYTENGDNISSVTLDSAGAPATAVVGGYAITATNATGTGLDNYSISYAPGTLNVTPADLTLTITANSTDKTYGTTLTFNGSEFTSTPLLNDDEITGVTLYSDGAEATANVGDYKILISDATGTGLDNYSINYVDGNLKVNPKTLTVTATDQTMTYGGSLPTLTASYNGFVNGEGEGDLTTLATVTSGTDATADAGTYTGTLTASGATAGNYTFKYVAGDLTIEKADLLVTANNDSKTYDGLEYTGGSGVTYDSFVNGDDADALGGTLIYGGTSQGATDANTYSITVSGLSSDNYNITYKGGTLTVDKADLLLTASDGSKTYGKTYSFDGDEYTASGLVDGDVIDSVTLATAGSDATANVGDYAITIGGATGDDLANYNVGYKNGTLTVNGAPLTITTDEQSKNFGEEDPELTFQITEGELLFEDGLFGELSREEGEAAGEYQILQNSLSAGANYTITYVGNVLTIWPLQPQPEADIAQEDIFNPVDRTEESGVGLSVTVTGLPVLPGTSNAPSAFELASIAPAAGGDEAQTAEDIAAIEPAAGEGEFAGCWDDAIFGVETGINTTYSFDYAPSDLLEDTANCGTTTVSE